MYCLLTLIAKYFEMAGQLGVIKKGASADFVLVASNPLDNLSNLRNVNGVMVRGQWITGENCRLNLKGLRGRMRGGEGRDWNLRGVD